MVSRIAPAFFFYFLACSAALADSNSVQSSVLIQRGDVQVTTDEFEQYVASRVPEHKRRTVLAGKGVVREMLANYFVHKVLATEAKAEGWYADPAIQARIKVGEVLMLSEMKLGRIAQELPDADWESLALERYRAWPEDYRTTPEVNASHILISTAQRPVEEAVAVAENILTRLEQGEDFEQLARQYSDDQSVSRNGGQLGFFTREKMVAEFSEAAFSMNVIGEVSKPIKTQFGVHLIRLEGKRGGEVRPFDDVKEQIVTRLKRDLTVSLRTKKIEEVRAASDIVVEESAVRALELEYLSTK